MTYRASPGSPRSTMVWPGWNDLMSPSFRMFSRSCRPTLAKRGMASSADIPTASSSMAPSGTESYCASCNARPVHCSELQLSSLYDPRTLSYAHGRNDLRPVRDPEPSHGQVLSPVRIATLTGLPERPPGGGRRHVLRPVRRGRGTGGPGPIGGGGSFIRAASGHRPVRRPGRVHLALRGPGPRRGSRVPEPLLRHVSDPDRPVRRDRGEVHRRRGDGRVGHTGGAGG